MQAPRRTPFRARSVRSPVLLALLAVAAGAPGCGAPEPAEPPRSGTARMADSLAAVYARALANPMDNPFLSRERAEAIQATVARQPGPAGFTNRMKLATARLAAGQAREAIAEIESLMREAGTLERGLTAETKPLYDLAALAYLRLGEQENCLQNPSSSVCILPLDRSARHANQEGARGAIARYTEILRVFPEDRGSQWLLNLAYQAIGGFPDSVPRRYRIAALAAKPRTAFPVFPNIAGDVGVAISGLAGGLNVEDFNGDGLLDVFTTSWGLNDPVHLYLADGRGRFSDHSDATGLEGIVGGLNTVHADYDNDGDVDVFVLRGAWLRQVGNHPNSLLRNRGDGSFEDVTFEAGIFSMHPTQTAAWADFNLDGHLDLFIGNESLIQEGGPSHPSELYLGNGRGGFTEVAERVGIRLNDFVKGVVWGDVNNDGLPDLYASVLFGRNRLYLNRGGSSPDAWRFEEVAHKAGVQLPIASFPVWFWDYDQDGWEDLLVLSYDLRTPLNEAVAKEYLGLPNTVESSRLYRNQGDGTFEDRTAAAGLDGKVVYAMGSNFGDLDNDGWLDFYLGTGNPDLQAVIPNRMFKSIGGARFEEVTLPGGFGHIQKGHGVAFADFDRDGDQDVYIVLGGAFPGDRFASALFENPGWKGRAWVSLELEGRTANRSAIGARVEVDLAGPRGARRTVYRTVGTGGSFGAGPLRLQIGLGDATRITEVRIRWPDSARTRTVHSDLEPNRAYRIVQGAAPVPLDAPPLPFRKVPLGKPPGDHPHP
jgi:hypothetical protein